MSVYIDAEDDIMAYYTVKLKNRYNSHYIPEHHWPPLDPPPKFTKIGFMIHKPKRTAKDTKNSAMLARSGSLPSENTIKEEISSIFLPVNINKRPQIILIEGAPGIGKTMLMNEIKYLWANGKILKDKKMIYFLSLRDPKINEMHCTEDMFFYACKNKRHAKILTEYFENTCGQGLVILLDGLDENPSTMQSKSFLHSVLIENKIFIEACIVITSRPHATINLLKHVSCRVEITGFTDKRRQEFVQENLEENAEDLKSYLQKHEIIDTLCYIPLNMTIVLFLFKEKVGLEDLPNTQTDLTNMAVTMTVFHNLEKLGMIKSENDLEDSPDPYDKIFLNLPEPYNEIFYYLFALAYKALDENKLTFTSNEIKEACPVPTDGYKNRERAIINGLGLMQTARFFADGDGITKSLSNFAHYSVQELLAAWYIAFSRRRYLRQCPLTCGIQQGIQKCLQYCFQLCKLKDKFWKGDFINMWSYYIGLTRGEDFAFKDFLSGNSPCSYIQNKMIKGLYFQYGSADHMDVEQCVVSKETLENKIKTLLLYFLLQEAPDNGIIKHLGTVVTHNKLDISKHLLGLTQDLFLLSHILSRPYLTKRWEVVDLSHCEINDEIFVALHDVLTRNDGRPKPEIKVLHLAGNKLESCSDALANLVCCQKVLHLNISRNLLKDLIPFMRCGDILEILHASNNKLSNEKVTESLTALQFLRKLKVLNLKHNSIHGNQDVTDAIGLALCSCNSLEELELDGNDTIFVEKIMLLFELIKELRNSKSDEHYYDGQPDKASAFLKIFEHCNKIDYQPDMCTLRNIIIQSKVIDISCNGLEIDDGCSLGSNLPLLVNLKTLTITENNISDKATKSLTMGMLFTHSLKKFHCDQNLFSDESHTIFKMIYQLRVTGKNNNFKCVPSESTALVFILKCISDLNKEELQSSDIVSTLSYIKKLEINHVGTALDYKLTSEDLKELCTVLRWFKQLEVLDVSNNEITVEAKESMAKIMLQIHTFNNLILNGNPIFDDELSVAVFENIKNVRENKLKSIIFNQNNCLHIKSIIYIMECLHQLENPNCFTSFDNVTSLDTDSQSEYGAKFLEHLNFLPFLKILKVNHVNCITDSGIIQLNKYLSHNRTLQILDLSYCHLKNLELEDRPSSEGIPLELIKFNHNNLTDNALLKLSLNLLKFTNLNQLDLEGNHFGDKGIISLYQHDVFLSHKPTITALNLADNQLTDGSAPQIFKIVQICKVKYLNISCNSLRSIIPYHTIRTLEELNISCNMLKVNAAYLGQNLHLLGNLKVLDITKNHIPDKATKSLTTGILLTPNLKEFKYDQNLFSEDSTTIFKMVHRLRTASNVSKFTCVPSTFKAFLFILNCINDNEEKVQSSDIVSTIGLITELNLSHNEPTTLDNRLTSEDIKELFAVVKWLKSLETLDVKNNNITDKAMEPVAKIMLQIHTFNNLMLIGNPIVNDELSMAVFNNVKNVRENKLKLIIYNQKNYIHIESIICILECLHQLENPNCFDLLSSITTLDTNSQSDYGAKFLKYLNFLPCLKILKVNHVNCITDSGIIQLNKYLSHNRTLQILDLSYCNLKSLELEDRPSRVENAPGINNSLDRFKCNYSKITDGVLSSFALMIINVRYLELEGNYFGDKGICDLHNVLLSCENDQQLFMTTLNLANNQITSKFNSVVKIIEIVEKYKVVCLNVSDNQLQAFSCCKKHTVTTLKELYLSGNSIEINECFTDILQNSTQLEILDLENNKISNNTFKYLATGYLFTNKLTLKNLRLNGNCCMDNPNNKSVLKMIQTLHRDDYQYFKCVPENFEILLTILELVDSDYIPIIISRIEFLDISYSSSSSQQIKVRSSGIREFCKYLKYFKSLKSINMCGNNITEEDEQPLANAILKNQSVIEIKLEGTPIYRTKKGSRLFDTIGKMRMCGDCYCAQDHPKTLGALVDILEYVNAFEDRSCDITTNIKHLNISNFCQPQKRSSTSSIEENEKIVVNLIHHLKLFCTLKKLNLSQALSFSETDVYVALDELAITLRDNDTLEKLDISNNNILAKGALIILKSLEKNRTLRELNLTYNGISGEKKCKEIALIIRSLKLHHIDVDI